MKFKMLLWLLLFFSTAIFAVEHFPSQCRVSGLRFTGKSISLYSQHTAMPRLYVIHNISKHSLWITHESKSGRGMSAGWASSLHANHWSAILIGRRQFSLICQYQRKSGGVMNTSCRRVIRICQFSHVYTKNPIGGDYWVAENVVYHALVPRIRHRGFVIGDR